MKTENAQNKAHQEQGKVAYILPLKVHFLRFAFGPSENRCVYEALEVTDPQNLLEFLDTIYSHGGR